MRHIYKALYAVVKENEQTEIIFPVHRNPEVRKVVEEELAGKERVHLIETLEYEPFVNVMSRCNLILTDSGGIQEEAPALGKPVLVLRDTTERPEAVEAGTVRLIGTDEKRVYKETIKLLHDQKAYDAMRHAINPYGDGKAAARICDAILFAYHIQKERPHEFVGVR